MATLKEAAQSYQPHQIFNISELPEFSIDFELYEKTDKNQEGEEYSYKYLELNGKKYRVPNTVLEEIQKILKIKPDTKSVKVNKTGEGLTINNSGNVFETAGHVAPQK